MNDELRTPPPDLVRSAESVPVAASRPGAASVLPPTSPGASALARTSPAHIIGSGPTGTLASEPRPPRLLDRVREKIRVRNYSPRTEQAYVGWIRRFILFHGKRHPLDMGVAEISRYLSSLAVQSNVAASTQNQAFSALLFLYRLCAPEHKRGYVAAPVM
jgi:hypothetical protein